MSSRLKEVPDFTPLHLNCTQDEVVVILIETKLTRIPVPDHPI